MLSTATAAPAPITIDGREYLLSPLTMNDWGEFFAWAQRVHIALAREACDGLTAEIAASVMRDALLTAGLIGFKSSLFDALAASPEGMVRTLYLSARHAQPKITPDDIRQLMANKETRIALMDVYAQVNRRANGDAEDDEKKAASPTAS